jgi:hypothetical protein
MANHRSMQPTIEDARALTAFMPLLRDEKNESIVEWKLGEGFPHAIYDSWVDDLVNETARDCWSHAKYDPSRASEMIENDSIVRSATLDQIKQMLTYFVRAERFCDGVQGSLIRRGRMAAVMNRLQQLFELEANQTDDKPS